MKKHLVACSLLVLLNLSAGFAEAQGPSPKLLKHIVTVTFKAGASANEVKEADDSFRNLATKLQVVKRYDTGTALNDGKQKAVTHVYSFTFASEENLASYVDS